MSKIAHVQMQSRACIQDRPTPRALDGWDCQAPFSSFIFIQARRYAAVLLASFVHAHLVVEPVETHATQSVEPKICNTPFMPR